MSAPVADAPAEQFVSDLLWAVNSPSFITGDHVVAPAFVTSAEVDGEALATFIADRSVRRVGRYFEALLLFWLVHVRKVELVGHGLQVRDGTRTLGEVDFLFVDESGELVHCEVAVKFYLHQPSRSGGQSCFPGPTATDDFETKVALLFDHQLELSREHFPDVTRREALVRGRLFRHRDAAGAIDRPERMADTCLAGRWIRSDETASLAEEWGSASLRIADKPFWMSPMAGAPQLSAGDAVSHIVGHFGESDRTLMIAVEDPATGAEAERLCVVPAQWDREAPLAS